MAAPVFVVISNGSVSALLKSTGSCCPLFPPFPWAHQSLQLKLQYCLKLKHAKMLQRFPTPGNLLPVRDVNDKLGGWIQGTTEVGGMGYCSGIRRGSDCANTAPTGHFSAVGLLSPHVTSTGRALM